MSDEVRWAKAKFEARTRPQVDVARLEELLAKATPGPWIEANWLAFTVPGIGAVNQKLMGSERENEDDEQTIAGFEDKNALENCQLTVAMREALPSLIAAVKALHAEMWITENGVTRCSWCDCKKEDGHYVDCIVGQALAPFQFEAGKVRGGK